MTTTYNQPRHAKLDQPTPHICNGHTQLHDQPARSEASTPNEQGSPLFLFSNMVLVGGGDGDGRGLGFCFWWGKCHVELCLRLFPLIEARKAKQNQNLPVLFPPFLRSNFLRTSWT
jgi:hypothetical protein